MKRIIAILVFMVGVACCYAQPFPLDYSYVGYRMSQQPIPNADVKVYVVKYENQADLKVYKVEYANQAGENDGKWFFTEYANQAKKKIYFVEYENQADLKIYFVEYENQAGWREKKKMHLMY